MVYIRSMDICSIRTITNHLLKASKGLKEGYSKFCKNFGFKQLLLLLLTSFIAKAISSYKALIEYMHCHVSLSNE